ncbi:MAG TPA: methyltransferase domain-containing protein, partial [Candidatus Saccharimonadales bacterium]
DIIQQRDYPKDIAGDELSLKIASYPATAQYLGSALRGKGNSVCELCCGVGISLIEFSKVFSTVIGVDNNAEIIKDCQRNLETFGTKNYELLIGDVSSSELLSQIKADIVLYDIPYWSNHGGAIDAKQRNPDLKTMVTKIRELITPQIAIYAPTHMTYEEISSQIGDCEYIEVHLRGKHDRNFILLGPLARKIGKTRIDLK